MVGKWSVIHWKKKELPPYLLGERKKIFKSSLSNPLFPSRKCWIRSKMEALHHRHNHRRLHLCFPLALILFTAHPFLLPVLSTERNLSLSCSPPMADGGAATPPMARKVKHEMEMFGDVRIDDYYWLRDNSRSDPEVLSYLRDENATPISSCPVPIFTLTFYKYLIYIIPSNKVRFTVKLNHSGLSLILRQRKQTLSSSSSRLFRS